MLVLPPRERVVGEDLHVQRALAPPRVEQQLLLHGLPALRPALILLSKPYFRAGVRYLLHPDSTGNLGEKLDPLVAQEVEVLRLPGDLRAEFRLEELPVAPCRVDYVVAAVYVAENLLEIGFRLPIAGHFVY